MAFRHSGPGMRVYRVADMRHPIFDGTGAMLHGARWNSPGCRVIYAAQTYSGALLELMVHSSGRVPANQGYIEIRIPPRMKIEVVSPRDVRGWATPSSASALKFGDRWYAERRTPVLIVPSVVTRLETNIILNQQHPDFRLIKASRPKPVLWDARLWPDDR